jgi:hypothetical protein
MRRFTARSFCLLPCFLLIPLLYFTLDPFRVLRWYPDYADMPVEVNRNVQCTIEYLHNRERYHYDAFILGNSHSRSFLANDWKTHLPADASPFHFDANAATLYDISSTLAFLDEQGAAIRHCLVVFDQSSLTGTENRTTLPLGIVHPLISHQPEWRFHWTFMRAMLTNDFLIKYADYSYFKKYRAYMKDVMRQPGRYGYDGVTNDFFFTAHDAEQKNNPALYELKRKIMFPARPAGEQPEAPVVTTPAQIAMLERMRAIFDRHHTQYAVVLSPEYEQHRLYRGDLDTLRRVFGEARVFDYSGATGFSYDIENFYEMNHFKPMVGRQIMNEIYHVRTPAEQALLDALEEMAGDEDNVHFIVKVATPSVDLSWLSQLHVLPTAHHAKRAFVRVISEPATSAPAGTAGLVDRRMGSPRVKNAAAGGSDAVPAEQVRVVRFDGHHAEVVGNAADASLQSNASH